MDPIDFMAINTIILLAKWYKLYITDQSIFYYTYILHTLTIIKKFIKIIPKFEVISKTLN